jgi:hypothetical protein
LDETNDKHFWRDAHDGVPLWKGESFDHYEPRGTGARVCPLTDEVLAKVLKPRPGGDSITAGASTLDERRAAVRRTWGRARLTYRQVTNRTNSRTCVAAFVPPCVLLGNGSPYLAFVDDDPLAEAACLGLLNSLVLDWQARRFVEVNLNFFILEGLKAPPALDDDQVTGIATRAALLSSVDERYTDFAAATGVELGTVDAPARDRLRSEIDALVAHAYDLDEEQLELVFRDFTETAVPEEYRQRVREAFRDLRG